MAGTHILIADDHPLFRDALAQALQSDAHADRLGDVQLSLAESLDGAISVLKDDDSIDLILLDLTMPGMRGLSGLMYLRAEFPGTPVVVVTASETPVIARRCIEFGASGFIPKSLDVPAMREAISTVIGGDIWLPTDFSADSAREDELAAVAEKLASLTPQQVRVLMMLGEGLLNKQIAYELGVSEATVKAHVSAILQKLEVDSRTQAVILVNRIDGLQRGHALVDVDGNGNEALR
jgi:DNA-binding NarL/FixJ family response regulator